jgi:TPR repeat protein
MKRILLLLLVMLNLIALGTNYVYAEKYAYNLGYNALRKRALGGDADAQYWMGQTYLEGRLECKPDTQCAVIWYKLSAENSNETAQCKLAEMYFYGIGIDIDYKEATKWYKECALGDGYDFEPKFKAKLMYANILGKGAYGETKDTKAAIKLASSARLSYISIGGNWLYAMQEQLLGELYHTCGQDANDKDEKLTSYEESVKHCSKAVKEWDSWRKNNATTESDFRMAITGLAKSYFRWGTSLLFCSNPNYVKILEKYQQAIDYGSEDAIFNAGFILMVGVGNVEVDKKKAVNLLSKLVGKDYRATLLLASYYYSDDVDYKKAFEYYKAIADDTSEIDDAYRADALQHISKMYRFGRYVTQDEALADYYLEQAAKFGDEDSIDLSHSFLNRSTNTTNNSGSAY